MAGELAIYYALGLGLRVFYTTPLKALSNQKVRELGSAQSTTRFSRCPPYCRHEDKEKKTGPLCQCSSLSLHPPTFHIALPINAIHPSPRPDPLSSSPTFAPSTERTALAS